MRFWLGLLALPALIACGGGEKPRQARDWNTDLLNAPRKAFDNILLAEVNEEQGPMIFPHRKHAASEAPGIGCARCHHDYGGPTSQPGSCRNCHSMAGEEERPDVPNLMQVAHERCHSCHVNPDPEYPGAHKTPDCTDCHTSIPEEPDLKAGMVGVRVVATAPYRQEVAWYLENRFGTPATKEIRIRVTILFRQVRDDLIPASSKTRLHQGVCDLVIEREGRPRVSRKILSKVFSGDDAAEARRKVIESLKIAIDRAICRILGSQVP
jgi:hypothetical protein